MANTKIIENGPYDTLMRKLINLKEFDALIEKKRKKWGGVALLSVVGAFVCLFLGGTVFPPLFAVAAILGVVFVLSLVMYIINVRKDLDNQKLDTAYRFVEILGQDVPSTANMALSIDFSAYTQGGEMLSKTGGAFSVKEKNYEHPWFKCSGSLYDGNKFEMEVVRCVKRKEKPKRKYTKVKEKMVEKAILSLKLNTRVYPDPEQVAQNVKTGNLPHGISVSRAVGRNRTLKVAAVTPPAVIVHGRYGISGDRENLFNGDKLLGVFIDAYSGLQGARPEQPESPPPQG